MPSMPQDGKRIIGYREAMTLPFKPKSMVVCGSGAIGSEFAFFYQSIGVQVTLVEFMPQILPNEDEDTASQISRSFRKMGMKVMASASVEKVDVDGDVCNVTIKDMKKNTETVVDCDVVLSAVGVITNLENLGLEETGIEVERTKIVVDDYYRTNVPGYYAIGDVVHGPALAHVASAEAICCVEKIAGHEPKLVNYNNIPGCTYTTPEVASVGLTEKKAVEAGKEVLVGKFFFKASGKATAAGNTDGFIKMVIDKNTDEIAEAVGTTPGNVRKLRKRALEKIRTEYARLAMGCHDEYTGKIPYNIKRLCRYLAQSKPTKKRKKAA
jgi:dihydrolipoamide dehydrogenase